MKRTSIVLNVILVLGILACVGYRFRPFAPHAPLVHFTSTSPDGKWRCVVTDVHPGSLQITYTYSIERIGGLPLDGTQYVSYEDSEGTGRPAFEWSANRLILRDYRKTLVAEFDDRYQHWRERPREQEAPTQPRTPIDAPPTGK